MTHTSSFITDVPSVTETKSAGYGPAANVCATLDDASNTPGCGYLGDAVGNPQCPLTDLRGFYRDFLEDKRTETTVGSTFTWPSGDKLNWYELAQENGGSYLEHPPGAKSEYSNFATGYLGLLVALKGGMPFDKFCQDKIFNPLGMTNTAWFVPDQHMPAHAPANATLASPTKYYKCSAYKKQQYHHYNNCSNRNCAC